MLLNTLVLKDAANADVTFNRESAGNEQVILRKAGTTYEDAHRVAFNSTQPTRNGSVVRLKADVTAPVFDPTTKLLLRTNRFTVEVYIPISAPAADRDLIAAYVKSLVATTSFQSMIKDIDLPQ